MMVAMGTNRTMFLIQGKIPYRGMYQVFQTLNSGCSRVPSRAEILQAVPWKGKKLH